MKEKVNDQEDIYGFLMSNKDFRDWVLNPTENRRLYWEKWIAHNNQYIGEVERAKATILGMRFKENFLSEEKLESILANVISSDTEINKSSLEIKETKSVYKKWFLVAATLMLSLVSAFIINEKTGLFDFNKKTNEVALKEIVNPKGQKSRIKLPDGSTVILNSGSTLRFREHFSEDLRNVELKGEAFFEIVKDKSRPFIVESNGIKTRVLGTKFNVRSFDKEPNIDISLVEGKVAIEGGDRSGDYILKPGETIRYNKTMSSFKKSEVDLETLIGWKDGVLIFKNTGFEDFVNKIETWYGVDVIVKREPEKVWKVNGKFKDEPLESVLLGLKFTHNIDYRIDEKRVELF